MDPKPNGDGWKLEVVRGRDVGRSFALSAGEMVLGNDPGTGIGSDLASQESEASPRRMAGRHASLDWSPTGLRIRDLESPGGTFVNRQRILAGQAKPLKAGDVIQLGGVQLKVVAGSPSSVVASPMASPDLGPFVYHLPGGPTCRSWDDLLTASAQRWEALRGELVSGRLAGFLVAIGRPDLAPSPATPGSPDERLDAWLGQLPTTRPARPELDVHPSNLMVRVVPGGGTVRRSVQVANVGLRLLKSSARLDPSDLSWLKLEPPRGGQPFTTIEGTTLGLEVIVPETLPTPLSADLVIEGNGGSKRIRIVLEAKPAAGDIFEPTRPSGEGGFTGITVGELVARQSTLFRMVTWPFGLVAARLLVGLSSGALGADTMAASGGDSPRLLGVAVMMAGLGGTLGGLLAWRRGGPWEIPTGASAGGIAGVITSAALVAACRSIEPILGGWATSVIAVCALWAVLGAALAGLSTRIVKGRS